MTTIKWGEWERVDFDEEIQPLMIELSPFCMTRNAENQLILIPAEDVNEPGVVVFEARINEGEFQMRNTVAVGKPDHTMTGAEQVKKLGSSDCPAHSAVFSGKAREIIQHGNRRK